MVIHNCPFCGFSDTLLSEVKKHLIRDHNKKKGDEVEIHSIYKTEKYNQDHNWITI